MLLKKVEHDATATTKGIIVKYDNGRSDMLEKGVAIRIEEIPGSEELAIKADLLRMTDNDMRLVISSMVQFGYSLGLFQPPEKKEGAENE